MQEMAEDKKRMGTRICQKKNPKNYDCEPFMQDEQKAMQLFYRLTYQLVQLPGILFWQGVLGTPQCRFQDPCGGQDPLVENPWFKGSFVLPSIPGRCGHLQHWRQVSTKFRQSNSYCKVRLYSTSTQFWK